MSKIERVNSHLALHRANTVKINDHMTFKNTHDWSDDQDYSEENGSDIEFIYRRNDQRTVLRRFDTNGKFTFTEQTSDPNDLRFALEAFDKLEQVLSGKVCSEPSEANFCEL